MSSIPEELHYEILLRLPVGSLLKCKSVCKNWYALITSSDFINIHLNLTAQTNNPNLMLQGYYGRTNNELYSITYNSVCEFDDDAINIGMDYPFKSLDYDVFLMGSCNGVVCLWLDGDGDGDRRFLCLWNPATREYKHIPKSPIGFNIFSICMCALGYDHKTDDYKLTVGINAPGIMHNTLVLVYSLASDSWTTEKTLPYWIPSCTVQKSGVLVKGYFHWLGQVENNHLLLSLDISDETFKEMQLSKELLVEMKDPYACLGVLEEGCLCVLFNLCVNGVQTHSEVWEMLDYGVGESWTRRYIFTHERIIRNDRYKRLMWSFEKRKILLLSPCHLVLYDPEDGSARELNTLHISYFVKYVESLVSLKSGTYVGGEGLIDEI